MIISLLPMLLAGADPATLMTRAADRLSATPTAAPARSARYRVAGETIADRAPKERALREDGRECSVIGARVCTNPPRQLLTAAL